METRDNDKLLLLENFTDYLHKERNSKNNLKVIFKTNAFTGKSMEIENFLMLRLVDNLSQ